MNDRVQAVLDRINERWRLHERMDKASGPEGRCLAFVIDRRYLDQDGIEMRLAVSFGGNPVSPETEHGSLPIPARPGRFVFGLHQVGTKGNRLAMYDRWVDAREAAADCTDAAGGEKSARSILESISDAECLALLGDSPEDQGPVEASPPDPLGEVELVEDEDL